MNEHSKNRQFKPLTSEQILSITRALGVFWCTTKKRKFKTLKPPIRFQVFFFTSDFQIWSTTVKKPYMLHVFYEA